MCSSHRLGFGATDAPIGHIPSTIVSSDFNGDGLPDVATLNADETVSVILGLGDGTFGPAQDYVLASASAGSSQLMVAADFNGDGYPDLAVVETGGKVQLLAGSATGALTAEPALALTGTTTSLGLVTADFDGDGKPDLAIFGDPSGRIAVLTNTGALAFTESDPQLFSSAPVALAAADMDGDGRPDLVGALTGTSTLVIALNKSSGFTQAPLVTLPNVATSLAVADVDGDKKNDLVAGFIDGSVQVMIGNGAGGLGAAQKTGAAGTTAVAPVALADVTGDGLIDIVALSPSQLTLFPSATLGTWSAPVGFSVADATGLASVDVNKDGAADVLVDGFALAGSVSVLLAAPRTYLAGATLIDTTSGNFSAPLVVDVNGDGHLGRRGHVDHDERGRGLSEQRRRRLRARRHLRSRRRRLRRQRRGSGTSTETEGPTSSSRTRASTTRWGGTAPSVCWSGQRTASLPCASTRRPSRTNLRASRCSLGTSTTTASRICSPTPRGSRVR